MSLWENGHNHWSTVSREQLMLFTSRVTISQCRYSFSIARSFRDSMCHDCIGYLWTCPSPQNVACEAFSVDGLTCIQSIDYSTRKSIVSVTRFTERRIHFATSCSPTIKVHLIPFLLVSERVANFTVKVAFSARVFLLYRVQWREVRLHEEPFEEDSLRRPPAGHARHFQCKHSRW